MERLRRLSLVAYGSGKNTIRQIGYDIREGRPPYLPTPDDFNRILKGEPPAKVQTGQIGDLAPQVGRPFLVVHPSQDNGAYYNINIIALNGLINEKLQVRFNRSQKLWERQYTITRGNRVIEKRGWNR